MAKEATTKVTRGCVPYVLGTTDKNGDEEDTQKFSINESDEGELYVDGTGTSHYECELVAMLKILRQHKKGKLV